MSEFDLFPEPVTPATRTSALVAAYSTLFAGLVVAAAAGIVLLVWFSRLSRLEVGGLGFALASGMGVVLKATAMFDAVSEVAPLPNARLRD